MKKIKDRVILGVICSFVAGVVPKVTNAIEYRAGLTDMRFNQPAASLFLPKREAKANTTQGKVIASLVNNSMGGITGVIITYLLTVTGRDRALIKGAGMGALQWIGIYGFLSRLGLIVKGKKAWTSVLSFIDHIALGALTAVLISKLGDDSLFPDKKVKRGEKLPIVAITNKQSKPIPVEVRSIKNRHA